MTVEEYRSAPGLNFSKMKALLQSPLHFQKQEAVEETLAMRMGTAVDEWVLSGKVRPHVIKPAELDGKPWQGNRTACKEWVKKWKADGCTVYSQDEYDTQSAMQKALENSREFQGLLRTCPQRQLPVFAVYRGVPVKCLLDMAGQDEEGRVICDLKTSNDASPKGFGKKAFNMDYDLQMVLYSAAVALSEGLEEPPAMSWAVVESSAAAPVSLFLVPGEALESGQRKLDRCIDSYLECMESGIWPSYGTGFQTPEWPRWAA